MQTRKQWFGYVGALTYGALMGFSGIAAAATEPHSITISYASGETAATATISWKSDAPRAYGFDVNRREAGTSAWTRIRYATEPNRRVIDTNLKPLTRYEYQVVSYRPGSPATGYPSNIASTTLDFPYNVPYPNGIVPTNYSQAQKNADLNTMYGHWRARYMTTVGAGVNGMRVYKPGENDETVSEGMGYGMLISVYMATANNTGKADFDKLLTYYKSKEGGVKGPVGLMAWQIDKDGKILSTFPAPDGDIDTAYALLVADKKWGSNGAINYKQEGINIINNLMKRVVQNRAPGDSQIMASGERTPLTRTEQATDITMSSYLMTSYFRQFGIAAKDTRWTETLAASYKYFDYFYYANPATGLTPFTALTKPGSTQYQPSNRGYNYGFDACRVPWRVGIDYLWHGNSNSSRTHDIYPSINKNLAHDLPHRNTNWFKTISTGDPQLIATSYALNGTKSSGAYFGSQRSMVSPMIIGAMVDSSNQTWLNTLYSWLRVQVPGQSYTASGVTAQPGYYFDTVMMVNMMVVTGNMPNLPDSSQ